MFDLTPALVFFGAALRALRDDGVDFDPRDHAPLPSPVGFGYAPRFGVWLSTHPAMLSRYEAASNCGCVVCNVYGGDCATSLGAEWVCDEYARDWDVQDAAAEQFYQRRAERRRARKAQERFDSILADNPVQDPEGLRRFLHATRTRTGNLTFPVVDGVTCVDAHV